MPKPRVGASSRARALRQSLPSGVAALLAIAIATVATLAVVQLLPAARKPLVGARPRPPAVATPSPTAATPSPVPVTPSPPGTASPPSSAPSPIRLGREPSGRQALVALPVPPTARAASAREEAARVLAASHDGQWAASVERFGAPGPLHLTGRSVADRQVQVGPDGASAPVAAAFAPDGSWLAVVDGTGQLWRVDVSDGSVSLVSPGSDGLVFGLSLAFADDGRIFLTQVGSVDIPMPSRVAVLDPRTGAVKVLSPETSAYSPVPVADGSLLFFTTRPDGTTDVRRIENGRETVLAALGATSWVDAGRDGRRVVAERLGSEIAIVELASGSVSVIGTGARPELSPSGDRVSVLDFERRRARVLDLQGRELSIVNSLHVAWAECPEGCDS